MEHTHGESAGTNRGVADFDPIERVFQRYADGGAIVGEEVFTHERLQERAVETGLDVEVGKKRLLAHVANHFVGRVEGTFVLVVLQEILEDLPKHIGCNADFGVGRVGFVDGKVELVEEVEEVAEVRLGETADFTIKRVALEERAGEEGDADGLAGLQPERGFGDVARRTPICIQGVEEKRFQNIFQKVEVRVRDTAAIVREQFLEVAALALVIAPRRALWHAHPTFLLEELQEDKAPHHLFHVVANGFAVVIEDGVKERRNGANLFFLELIALPLHRQITPPGDFLNEILINALVLIEEPLAERLDGEGIAIGDEIFARVGASLEF